ncbi:aldo/keto reductase [Pseudonocardia kunmingensis]|uniref:Diketogulonate reductase-like aldo/keto reductase n=1 Tax=Pseudonocardia kunmingensis TaxID=630975 RepID=A0A543DVD3_9PSEU|nr:aldo/keto reductase [Pseudonocardia kunmingensis]TQM13285.1 diketogulonate reductase-like aldo/keto reductase [Pseudonocardia kunmingensis]
MTPAISTVSLPSGEVVPALGQGTWGWAEDPHRRGDEIAALHAGLDLGLTLVDTAEMYADGAAEDLLGEALEGRRDEVFLVSKVLPGNATRRGTVEACERSLRRLRTDRLDLYLLHWRGRSPLGDTVAAFDDLVHDGKIRYWGVSNLDAEDLAELAAVPGGDAVATDQVLYNLTRRGVEHDLLPQCRDLGIPVMAYSPIEQGRMLDHPALRDVAESQEATPAQVALAWLLRQDGIVAIPRAGSAGHVRENHAALDLRLTEDNLAALDRAFPAPTGPQPLEVL